MCLTQPSKCTVCDTCLGPAGEHEAAWTPWHVVAQQLMATWGPQRLLRCSPNICSVCSAALVLLGGFLRHRVAVAAAEEFENTTGVLSLADTEGFIVDSVSGNRCRAFLCGLTMHRLRFRFPATVIGTRGELQPL